MFYFIFRGYDDPAASAVIRERDRADHRLYIRETRFSVSTVAGGMVVTDEGDAATGTMLVLRGPNRAAVLQFLEGDPYSKAGLFACWEVDRWDWKLGQPDE